MAEMNADSGSVPSSPVPETCAQCLKTLTPEDRAPAGDRVFCAACFESLQAQLQQAVVVLSSDINYFKATIGALSGGVIGVLAWWGFTVLTKIAFGLVAVAIGVLVGLGTVKFAGDKRSRGLQALSIAVSVVSFIVATYLVNMTFINRMLAEKGESFRLGFPPASIALFANVVGTDFGMMDFVFLAIVIYEAWKIPRPIILPGV